MKKIEMFIYNILKNNVFLRRIVKRIYHLVMYTFSKRTKVEGEFERITPIDNYEYFFGYYDKSPWDANDRYILGIRVDKSYKNVAPKQSAEIVLIDTKNNYEIKVISKTNAWNVQQGCMLQWRGSSSSEIVYNDYLNENYCTVLLDIKTNSKVIIKAPIYSLDSTGEFGLSLDFSRLHTLRPGYGYSNQLDKTGKIKVPNEPCISFINLRDHEIKPILTYQNLIEFENRKEMDGAFHKVNHIMINPSGNRFMFLHRWQKEGRNYSRLITSNLDGSNLYNLSDDNFVSHCNWIDNEKIIGFLEKKKEGKAYFILEDKTNKYKRVWNSLDIDGHPSISPTNKNIAITDSYPNNKRLSSLFLITDNTVTNFAKVYSPFKYDNNVRCDLHPRWNNAGSMICIDATFEGKRAMYTINPFKKVKK